MSKTTREKAEIAANWWAEIIQRPKFDNGDNSSTGGIASIMASTLTKEISEESINHFKENLTTVIDDRLNEEGYKRRFTLDVDYHPCFILCEAAERSGVPLLNFPWKTTMWIEPNSISVSYGYRGKRMFLYANKEYWRKQISDEEQSIRECEEGIAYTWIKDEKDREREIKMRIMDANARIEECKVQLELAEE